MESNEWTRDQLRGGKGGTVPEQCGISPKAGPCQDDWAWTESSAGSVPAVIWLCHFTFISLSFFSWTQGKGPHLFIHQGQCEKRWEQVCKSGVCEGRWGWEVPGTLVWGQSQTWMRAPILWLCPALEAAAHCLSQALGLEEGGDSSEASLPAAVVPSCSPQGWCRRQGSLRVMWQTFSNKTKGVLNKPMAEGRLMELGCLNSSWRGMAWSEGTWSPCEMGSDGPL